MNNYIYLLITLFVVFVFSLLCCRWSVSTFLSAFFKSCSALLLVLAHGGALRLGVTQFINGVINVEVVRNGSGLCVQ